MNKDTNNQTIGHITFLGQSGAALLQKDEALLVPNPLYPPAITPRYLLEPIGKKYAITVELTDNSLDSDYLCFQVNTAEEIHPALQTSEPTLDPTTEINKVQHSANT